MERLRDFVAFRRYLDAVRQVNWVVYATSPFAGAEQVLEYVGRYTHLVAIANNRIVNIEDGKMRFRWKDYRNENRQNARRRGVHPSGGHG
ncbi:transposase [Bradyrhizobium sp. B124]|uniref:transposase n=1 Tax=Bradyrhizobium sp. B124 TaxID=3140245 RepID=UPI0031844C34